MNKACVWKPVPGYPGYDVSSQGEVRSWHQRGGSCKLKEPKLIKSYSIGNRMVASISVYGRPRLMLVSTLMRLAFFPDSAGMIAYHINGNSSDNRIDNIGVITKSEALNLVKTYSNYNCRPVAKLDEFGCIIKLYPSIISAAEDNNISRRTVGRRCLKNTDKPLCINGFTFQFADNVEELITPLIDMEVSDADL